MHSIGPLETVDAHKGAVHPAPFDRKTRLTARPAGALNTRRSCGRLRQGPPKRRIALCLLQDDLRRTGLIAEPDALEASIEAALANRTTVTSAATARPPGRACGEGGRTCNSPGPQEA